MRANEFTSTRVMAKIEKTGQIVQIMKHQDGDFLINTNPDTKSHMGVKWIPDTTRFAWVRNFDMLKEMRVGDFEGIDIDVEEDADEITVRAMAGGRQMGYAYFVKDGQDLLPQDLEIDPRYQGQGIARVLYDFLKSQGYSIRRSGQQTAAGTGFWQKHRPGQNVWEE